MAARSLRVLTLHASSTSLRITWLIDSDPSDRLTISVSEPDPSRPDHVVLPTEHDRLFEGLTPGTAYTVTVRCRFQPFFEGEAETIAVRHHARTLGSPQTPPLRLPPDWRKPRVPWPTDGQFQAGWRWCSRCRKLGWSDPFARPPRSHGGHCIVGADHDWAVSSWYVLRVARFSGYTAGWRYCNRCLGVTQPAENGGTGRCWDSFPHDLTVSSDYFVHSATGVASPITEQSGWRVCSRCRCLIWDHDAGGVCFDREPHSLVASPEYLLPIGR